MQKGILALKNLYILSFVIMIGVIILHPLILEKNLPDLSHEHEEILEIILSALLFGLGYFIYLLYKKEIKKNEEELKNLNSRRLTLEERLEEAFKHIGQVNIQIQEIKAIFSGFKKYPESKNELKKIFRYFSEKILSIVAVDWVLFKIINLDDFKTLSEHCHCRQGAAALTSRISNHDLINNFNLESFIIFCSDRNDLKIKICCLIPRIKIAGQTEVLIKAIINQLEMIYLIFSSNYYGDVKVANISKSI